MSAEDGAPPAGELLTLRLHGFVVRCRDEGLRVGTGSAVDLLRAVRAISVLDRSAFREACRATLAKSPTEVALVDRLFEEYFGGAGAPVPPPSEQGKVPTRRIREGRAPPGSRPSYSPQEETDEKVRGRYSPTAPPALPGESTAAASKLRRYRGAAHRFRREVATLPGRRWTPHGGTPVDLRRTARAALRSAGEWVELARRDKAPRRADLLILWDVSGSMREHTPELFAFIYALHRVVRRTRVIAFGHEIVDVTPLLAGRSYERAAPLLAYQLRDTGGGTQIAHCLREFRRRHGSEIRGSTSVLIVSDGWDLGDTRELADELRRLRGRAHALAWVNPYAAKSGFRPATAALRSALPFLDLLSSPDDFPAPRAAVGLRAPHYPDVENSAGDL